MLFSREDFSFRNVYSSMLVGTNQLYTQKWFKKFPLETPFLGNKVKSKENVNISKSVSLFLLAYSFFLFNNVLSFLHFVD